MTAAGRKLMARLQSRGVALLTDADGLIGQIEAEVRAEQADRVWPDSKPPRYRWTEEGMVLDSKGAYLLAHMTPTFETSR